MNNMKKTIFITALSVLVFSVIVCWYLLSKITTPKNNFDEVLDLSTSLLIQNDLDHLDNYDMLYDVTQDSTTVVKIDSLRGEFLFKAKEFENKMNESEILEFSDSKKLIRMYINRLEN